MLRLSSSVTETGSSRCSISLLLGSPNSRIQRNNRLTWSPWSRAIEEMDLSPTSQSATSFCLNSRLKYARRLRAEESGVARFKSIDVSAIEMVGTIGDRSGWFKMRFDDGYHATTLNIKVERYRMREQRRASLLGASPSPKPEQHLPRRKCWQN